MDTSQPQYTNTPIDRAISTGGYFTLALIPFNIMMTDMYMLEAASVSITAGITFTLVNMLVNRAKGK